MKDQLSEKTAKELERIADLLWHAMDALTDSHGFSTQTLKLEGAVYDLRKVVEKAEVVPCE